MVNRGKISIWRYRAGGGGLFDGTDRVGAGRVVRLRKRSFGGLTVQGPASSTARHDCRTAHSEAPAVMFHRRAGCPHPADRPIAEPVVHWCKGKIRSAPSDEGRAVTEPQRDLSPQATEEETKTAAENGIFSLPPSKIKDFCHLPPGGRHPFRKPDSKYRPCTNTKVCTRRDEGIPPYGQIEEFLPQN